jgi:hypothetical protein
MVFKAISENRKYDFLKEQLRLDELEKEAEAAAAADPGGLDSIDKSIESRRNLQPSGDDPKMNMMSP